MHPGRTTALACAAAILMGCAAQNAATPRAQRNLVTAEELARTGEVSLYEALERVRPHFLRPWSAAAMQNPTVLTVFVGGMRMEGTSHLRDIMARSVREVRFLEPREANGRFGGNNSGGALLVELF